MAIQEQDKQILVTGITGQLGSALSRRIIAQGRKCAVFLRREGNPYAVDLKHFKVFTADITKRESLFTHANELRGKVDTIIHMASARGSSGKKLLFDNIVCGSVNLYEFANEIRCP